MANESWLVDPPLFKKVLSKYDLGSFQAARRLKKGYTNANFKISTDQGRFVLKICLEKSPEFIQYEIRLLTYLKKLNYPAAYPIANRQGKFLNQIEGHNIVLYEFVEGAEPALNPSAVRQMAAALAQLNNIQDWHLFERKNPLGLQLCREQIEQFPQAPNPLPEIYTYFEEETAFLSAPLQVSLPIGLIHGDFFADNTLYHQGKLTAILDFEEACTDHLIIDLGVAVNGFCFVGDQLSYDLLAILLTEYEQYRKLSKEERELLPYYIQWGAHCMIGWHLIYLMQEQDPLRLKRVQYLIQRVNALRKGQTTLEKSIKKTGSTENA